MKVLVTGATGFIGRHVVRALKARGDEVLVTSRDAARAERSLEGVRAFAWSPLLQACPFDALTEADAIIHLAGEPVLGRWSERKREAVRDSRVLATHMLVDTLSMVPEEFRPKVLVSASAVGYYGDRGDEVLAEDAAPGSDFLARVCAGWEAAAHRASSELGVRVVTPRLGIVLGPDGGVLARMRPLFKLFLGGRIGSGKQWCSWVHMDDVTGMLLHALDHEALAGPLNTCPAAVTNAELTQALGRVLGRPTLVPVPGLLLKAALGEASSLLLFSQRTKAAALEQAGYAFRHSTVEGALRACAAL